MPVILTQQALARTGGQSGSDSRCKNAAGIRIAGTSSTLGSPASSHIEFRGRRALLDLLLCNSVRGASTGPRWVLLRRYWIRGVQCERAPEPDCPLRVPAFWVRITGISRAEEETILLK